MYDDQARHDRRSRQYATRAQRPVLCALVLSLCGGAPAEAQLDDELCARSFCGCSTPTEKRLSAIVRDDVSEEPVAGIELRCEADSDVLATTDSTGQVDTVVVVRKSPGCNLGACNDLVATDPSGRYLTQTLRFPESLATLHLKLDLNGNPCAAIEVVGPITPLANACAERKLASAETALNTYVAERVAAYRADGEQERASALEKAQVVWVQTRNATCELVYLEFSGGTVAPVAFRECQVEDTEQRLARLREIFGGEDR